jgi:hypothetical protein
MYMNKVVVLTINIIITVDINTQGSHNTSLKFLFHVKFTVKIPPVYAQIEGKQKTDFNWNTLFR